MELQIELLRPLAQINLQQKHFNVQKAYRKSIFCLYYSVLHKEVESACSQNQKSAAREVRDFHALQPTLSDG